MLWRRIWLFRWAIEGVIFLARGRDWRGRQCDKMAVKVRLVAMVAMVAGRKIAVSGIDWGPQWKSRRGIAVVCLSRR